MCSPIPRDYVMSVHRLDETGRVGELKSVVYRSPLSRDNYRPYY